jgi:hypothetical protein
VTHTVFIDLDSHLETASASGTAAPDVPLKHLTRQTLAFAFHSGGTVSAVTGWSTGRVVIKATPTSDVLLLDTTLIATGSTTSTRYSAEWAAVDCDSAALRTLIGASVEPLDVFAEIQWTADSGTHAVAFPIQIVPTFNLPEDDPPDPTESASWTWLKARLAAGSNVTFTDNDTTQVRTIAASGGGGGGGGGGGSTDWGDIGGTLSDQTDLQTALNNKQPLAAALTTLSSATAAGLALMDDADAAAQRTTLELGNVDNTSDVNKPVSTAAQTALNLKQNTISGGALGSLFMNGGLGWSVVSKSTAIANLFGALPSPVNQSYAIGYDGTNIPHWESIGDLLKSIGTQAQGGVLVRGASTWEFLPVGTSGQFLKSNGAGANPEWAAPAGGGDALTTNALSQFAATTSAQLAGVISDETGTGALVFADSPTLVTPALGTPSGGVLTNCSGLPTAGLVDDAVTLAKMAAGTAGNLITYDASGNPAAVATGTAGQRLTSNGAGSAPTFQSEALRIPIFFSDQSTDWTTGLKVTFTWRFGTTTLSSTPIDCVTAPTGSAAQFDVKKNGTTIYSTKPTIDASETSTDTAATPAVISTTSLANGDIVTIHIDQIGSSDAGQGGVITFVGTTIP